MDSTLRKGKAEQSVLYNSVINRIKSVRGETVSQISEANDAAVIRTGSDTVISSGVVTEDIADKCYYAFYRALNNTAAACAEPVAVFNDIIMPEGTSRDVLKSYSDRFQELAVRENVDIAGGHSEVSGAVNNTVITVTCIGRPLLEKDRVLPDPKNGLSIIMTKYAGAEGTSILAYEKEKILQQRFEQAFIDDAKAFKSMLSVRNEACAALNAGPVIMHDASKGGVLSALWDIQAAYDCGLDIDLRAIPVRQETVEICELFGLDPCELLSGGAMLILTEDPCEITEALKKSGINSAVIGHTLREAKKILRSRESSRCMNRPAADAILNTL